MWHVASQITELNKIVNEHRDSLRLARSCFDKPDKMRELLLQLSGDIKDKKQVSFFKSSVINGLLPPSIKSLSINDIWSYCQIGIKTHFNPGSRSIDNIQRFNISSPFFKFFSLFGQNCLPFTIVDCNKWSYGICASTCYHHW